MRGVGAMSKGMSGLFYGTLGTTRFNSTQTNVSYSDRGVEIPSHIKVVPIKKVANGKMPSL